MKEMRKYALVTIGNILVDCSAEVEESFLKKYNLNKGGMHNFNYNLQKKIENDLEGRVEKSLGGSVANVASGINNLGLKAVLFGAVGNDANGSFYRENLAKEGIEAKLAEKNGRTGAVLVLITPDGERTFATNLGVSKKFRVKDFDRECLKNCDFFHSTGYELESMQRTIKAVMKSAKKKTSTSFDLADSALVKRNKKTMNDIVKNYVDVLFANEEEAYVLTGKPPEKALDELAKICKIVVVKLGKEGAFVKSANEKHYIPAYDVNVVNTNGAGDGFAAGFLYGLAKNYSLSLSGVLGAFYASKIVQQKTARLNYKILDAEKQILKNRKSFI